MTGCAVEESPGVRAMAAALLAACEVLWGYLGGVEVPEPALVELQSTRGGHAGVKVQVRGYERTAREQAVDLLAWSETLSSVVIDAWRAPGSETVLVTVSGTIAHDGAGVSVQVYASTTEPGPFRDLTPGAGRGSSVREVRRWALGDPPLGSGGDGGEPRRP